MWGGVLMSTPYDGGSDICCPSIEKSFEKTSLVIELADCHPRVALDKNLVKKSSMLKVSKGGVGTLSATGNLASWLAATKYVTLTVYSRDEQFS
jgi:hypothetical protein